MNWYAIYDSISGKIKLSVTSFDDDEADNNCQEGQSAAFTGERFPSGDYYINTETLRPNLRDSTPCVASTTQLAADGTASLTLSQMRADTQVTIDGPTTDSFTASGSETLTFIMPGVYTITATAPFPARPKEMTINAS